MECELCGARLGRRVGPTSLGTIIRRSSFLEVRGFWYQKTRERSRLVFKVRIMASTWAKEKQLVMGVMRIYHMLRYANNNSKRLPLDALIDFHLILPLALRLYASIDVDTLARSKRS